MIDLLIGCLQARAPNARPDGDADLTKMHQDIDANTKINKFFADFIDHVS